jgi:MFS family permease
MSQLRPTACVLLPFAAGYYLSYLFRTINALIANDLAADLDLNAFHLGLLTSVYFLAIAVVQLPLGALLDRYGPRTIQSMLLLLASIGALVFASSEHFLALLLGRALIGLGVAVALMAGFKAIVLWFPPQRLALANGLVVMLGALGALPPLDLPSSSSRASAGGACSPCWPRWRRSRLWPFCWLSPSTPPNTLRPLPQAASAYLRSIATIASGGSPRFPPSASARPGPCRDFGLLHGSVMSMASTGRASSTTSV